MDKQKSFKNLVNAKRAFRKAYTAFMEYSGFGFGDPTLFVLGSNLRLAKDNYDRALADHEAAGFESATKMSLALVEW